MRGTVHTIADNDRVEPLINYQALAHPQICKKGELPKRCCPSREFTWAEVWSHGCEHARRQIFARCVAELCPGMRVQHHLIYSACGHLALRIQNLEDHNFPQVLRPRNTLTLQSHSLHHRGWFPLGCVIRRNYSVNVPRGIHECVHACRFM